MLGAFEQAEDRLGSGEQPLVMMKVRLFMIVFKNYSRLGTCMHTANHPESATTGATGATRQREWTTGACG